jgi:ABC-type nitrate/sulfonate/bicarbonate transport system substrate-binding protein
MASALTRRAFQAGAAALLLGAGPTRAQAPTRLRVKVFPGAQNLALFAAQENGTFGAHGLDVALQFTQNSQELRNDLASGAVDIAHAAVDNAVAMRETGGHDIVVFIGGDSSMNELFVQPDVRSVADLRGRTLIVDAPNTAYALQAKKILLGAGLKPGDYQVKVVGGTFQRVVAMKEDRANAASTLNPPFSLQARAAGLKSLGRVVDLIGPYQASGGFAMRAWALVNGPALERYVASYVEALRWATAPANRAAATALLARRLEIAPALAEETYAALVEPGFGLAPDARFDRAGFGNVLALRAEIEGQWAGKPPAIERYVDLRWYDAGVARLGTR